MYKIIRGAIKSTFCLALALLLALMFMSGKVNRGLGLPDDPIAAVFGDIRLDDVHSALVDFQNGLNKIVNDIGYAFGLGKGRVAVMIKGVYCYVYPDGSWEPVENNVIAKTVKEER